MADKVICYIPFCLIVVMASTCYQWMNLENGLYNNKNFDTKIWRLQCHTMGISASEKCINKEWWNSKNREKESNLTLFLRGKSLKNWKNDM